jgi:hypothetical protein
VAAHVATYVATYVAAHAALRAGRPADVVDATGHRRAWLEAALVSARTTTNLGERVQAFHSADSALIRCTRIALDSLPELKSLTGPLAAEPDKWRSKASFDGASASAVMPFASWPYAIRPPQCLIEVWPARDNDQA